MARSVRILREADVRAALDMASCIDACERAFAAYATGGAELPAVIHLDVPESEGEIHVKAGHLLGEPFYAVKVASGFYAGEPAIDGLVMVFDATNGAPVAFMLDGGYITDVRTGAAGGVAARHLAPEHVEVVAILGTGGQARQQVDALTHLRPGIAQIRVWGRNLEHAQARADDLRTHAAESCAVNAVASVEDAVEGADVVITCTASRGPLIRPDLLAPGEVRVFAAARSLMMANYALQGHDPAYRDQIAILREDAATIDRVLPA